MANEPTLSDLQALRGKQSKQPTLYDLRALREKTSSAKISEPQDKKFSWGDLGNAAKEDLTNIGNSFLDVMTPPRPGDIEGSSQKGLNAAMLLTGKPIVKNALGGAKAIGELSADAAKGAILGASETGKTLSQGFHARTREQLDSVSSKMRKQATDTLKQAVQNGIFLKKEPLDKVMAQINKGLSETGLMNDKLHGDTMSVMKDLKTMQDKGGVSLESIEQHRQLLRQVVKKNTSKIEGPNPEVPKALAAIDSLDEALDTLKDGDFLAAEGAPNPTKAVELTKQYRQQWARARRFERISDIITSANGDADKIKDGMDRFIKRDSNLNGFTKEEKEAIKRLANYSIPEKIQKGVGTLGLNPAKKNFNSFVPLLEAGTTMFHSPYAAPGIMGGTAANLWRNYMTRGQSEALLNLIQGLQRADQ